MINNENDKKSSLQQMLESVRNMMKASDKEDGKSQHNLADDQDILELTEAEFIETSDKQQDYQKNNDVLSQLDNILKKNESVNVFDNSKDNITNQDDNAKKVNKTEEVEEENNQSNVSSNTEKENPSVEKKIIEEAKDALISETTSNATISAIKELKKKIDRPLTDGLSFRNGTTMEDLVIEAIKPYLSEWLDKNLPNVVKHLVEKELKKLIVNDD